jgi:SPP1 Gp6-like portal protein
MSLADLERGLKALNAAEDDYVAAEEYYTGSNPEQYASAKLARALRAYEARFRLRLARVPVDAVANRLEIASVTVNKLDDSGPVDESGPPKDQNDGTDKRLTQLLQDAVRDANDMEVEEPEVMFRASEFGDSYLIVDFDEENKDISLYWNSPYECRVIYDQTGRYKLFAIKVWQDYDPDIYDRSTKMLRATLFYPDAIEEYRTYPGDDGTDVRHWLPYGAGSPYYDELGRILVDEDTEEPILDEGIYPYNFGQVPVFHFRNGKPYGTPEHEAAYGPQDMIDKLVITHMATIDFQGFPQRYALQDPNAAGDDSQDWSADADDGEVTVAEPENKLKSDPGNVWWIDGAKAVGQFDVANADAFLKPLNQFVRAMSTVTETPLHLFDVQGQPPTGESRRTAEGGQTRKIRRRQRQYGATWREVYAYCLSLLTGEDYDELKERIEITWVPAESIDPNEAWELAGKKKGVGLPLTQILEEGGYSPDAIRRIEELAMEERKATIELQREQFQASMQERRDDRPDRPNPTAPGGDKPKETTT